MPSQRKVDAPIVLRKLEAIRQGEERERQTIDFAHAPGADRTLGPDPYALARLPQSERFVGILRGRDAVVLLDERLNEIARAPGPRSPTGLAVAEDGSIFAVGELDSRILSYTVQGDVLRPLSPIELGVGRALKDVALGNQGVLYALDERSGELLSVWPSAVRAPRIESQFVGHGPLHLLRAGSYLLTVCLLDHAVVVQPIGTKGEALATPTARVIHDGPIWSAAAVEEDNGLYVALGGVEDHPLDRSIGSFGYIDSFLYLYRIHAPGGGKRLEVERLASIDLSDHGVVTIKTVSLELEPEAIRVEAVGAGSARRAILHFSRSDPKRAPSITTESIAPGVSARLVLGPNHSVSASPLLDAWVSERPELVGARSRLSRVPDADGPERSLESRLGEALIFTTLIAPWNSSKGSLSRFTCETCHFDGWGDGRVHFSGRGEVHVVTKPLLGLFANRPYFSRALDYDLTEVAHNEFWVASQNSGRDPWFWLETAEFSWLSDLGEVPSRLSPDELRRAFVRFLIDFNHRPNPAVSNRRGFSALERRGAQLFQQRCESCHQSRTATDLPKTRIPPEAWEGFLFQGASPITWGLAEYRKTGVTPYVHSDGARVPALRRLYKKWPYFTNGSAKSLDDVLERVRFGEGPVLFHDGAPADVPLERLDAGERQALLAFLEIL